MVGLPVGSPLALEFWVFNKFTIECGPSYIIGLNLPPASRKVSEAFLVSSPLVHSGPRYSSPSRLNLKRESHALGLPSECRPPLVLGWLPKYIPEVAPFHSSHLDPSSWQLPPPLTLSWVPLCCLGSLGEYSRP
jgi:hypothetical protein